MLTVTDCCDIMNVCLSKGRISSSELRVHSSFLHPLEVRSITFSPNSSLFRYVPIKEKPVVMGASHDTLVRVT